MTHTLAWLAIVAGVALLTAAITRIVSRPRELPLSEIQELKRKLTHAGMDSLEGDAPSRPLLPSA